MGIGERPGKEGENRVDRLASYTALMASGIFQGQPAPTLPLTATVYPGLPWCVSMLSLHRVYCTKLSSHPASGHL